LFMTYLLRLSMLLEHRDGFGHTLSRSGDGISER
jgi:hypothetical protein